jgi:hypothetical protein
MTNIFFAATSWLVPGLGHVLSGHKVKGLIYAATLLGCFAAGEAMSEFRAVSRKEHDIAFWAQVGIGGPTLLAAAYDQKRLARDREEEERDGARGVYRGQAPVPVPRLLDCGIMYTCVAGLLNFVLIVDLLFPRPRPGRSAAPQAATKGGAGRD